MNNLKMKVWMVMILMAGFATSVQAHHHESEFTDYVNPWIGTGGHGHVFLGANVPFGLVQLGPTEHNQGWD